MFGGAPFANLTTSSSPITSTTSSSIIATTPHPTHLVPYAQTDPFLLQRVRLDLAPANGVVNGTSFRDIPVATADPLFLVPISDPIGLALTPLMWCPDTGRLVYAATTHGSGGERGGTTTTTTTTTTVIDVVAGIEAPTTVAVARTNSHSGTPESHSIRETATAAIVQFARLVVHPSEPPKKKLDTAVTPNGLAEQIVNIQVSQLVSVSGMQGVQLPGPMHFVAFDPLRPTSRVTASGGIAASHTPVVLRARRVQADWAVCPDMPTFLTRSMCTVLGLRGCVRSIRVGHIVDPATPAWQLLDMLDTVLGALADAYLAREWTPKLWTSLMLCTLKVEDHEELVPVLGAMLHRFWATHAVPMLTTMYETINNKEQIQTQALHMVLKELVCRSATHESQRVLVPPIMRFVLARTQSSHQAQREAARVAYDPAVVVLRTKLLHARANSRLSLSTQGMMTEADAAFVAATASAATHGDVLAFLQQNHVMRSRFEGFLAYEAEACGEKGGRENLFASPAAPTSNLLAARRARTCHALLIWWMRQKQWIA